MSSVAARNKVKTFLSAEFPAENFVDMDGGYTSLADFLADQGVTIGEAWVGLNFESDSEEPITIDAGNSNGVYRENGLVLVHVVEPARLSVQGVILSRAEALRDKLRGQNINGLKVLSVSPPSFSDGATLDFEDGGHISATFRIDFELDKNL